MCAEKNQVTTPELEQFVVVDVQLTQISLGTGAYGSVEEVEISGTRVAAKKLHSKLIDLGSQTQVYKWVTAFVEECKLMSQLRHPHIVQFLGICYLPGSPIPVLLMEKLQSSLDNLLETTPNIPLDVQVHLLTGTAQGVVYLHSHTPPIAHRDLTARNILIDSGVNAKIGDLGVARMVTIQPGQLAATMTAGPGNNLYMPPETMTGQEEGTTRYNTAIDIFSFGVVSLFTLTQTFPKDLKPPNFYDSKIQRLVARSEIERREHYIQLMQTALGKTHSLVKLTLNCLEYLPENRPSAMGALKQLEEFGNTLSQNCTKTKLELIQQSQRQLSEKDAQIAKLTAENEKKKEVYEELITLQQQQLEDQYREIEQLSDQLHQLREEKATKSNVVEADSSKEVLSVSVTFNWRRCKDKPRDISVAHQPVVHNGKLYIKGSGKKPAVWLYTKDTWTELPPPSIYWFTIATLRGQLVVVGGAEKSTNEISKTILTFDEHSQQWVQSYPTIPKAVAWPAVVSYKDHLIVMGGMNLTTEWTLDVNVLDTNNEWNAAEPLPSTDHYHSVLIEDTVYLVGLDSRTVLRAHLPTLISGAMSGVWETLPNAPYYCSSPITIGNMLMTVGGSDKPWKGKPRTSIYMYSPITNEWTKISMLPQPMKELCCIILNSELFILGHYEHNGHLYACQLILCKI